MLADLVAGQACAAVEAAAWKPHVAAGAGRQQEWRKGKLKQGLGLGLGQRHWLLGVAVAVVTSSAAGVFGRYVAEPLSCDALEGYAVVAGYVG